MARPQPAPKQDEDRAAGAYGLADALFEATGYPWYELSNWARAGHQSRHNLVYWERQPYAAVAPGAQWFDGATRRWNAARLDAWLAALDPPPGASPALPPGGSELVDAAAASAEALSLGFSLPEASRGRPPWTGSMRSGGRRSMASSRRRRTGVSA